MRSYDICVGLHTENSHIWVGLCTKNSFILYEHFPTSVYPSELTDYFFLLYLKFNLTSNSKGRHGIDTLLMGSLRARIVRNSWKPAFLFTLLHRK